jgi:hypothetical protein
MIKVMKLAGIKKKKIEVSCIPNRLEERISEFHGSTILLDNKIHDII